jgi:hypothetical protein
MLAIVWPEEKQRETQIRIRGVFLSEILLIRRLNDYENTLRYRNFPSMCLNFQELIVKAVVESVIPFGSQGVLRGLTDLQLELQNQVFGLQIAD